MRNISRLNRYMGTLCGVLVGDSLGAPYEKQYPDAIKQDLQKREGLSHFAYPDPFFPQLQWPAGRPTDDSELTAGLAEALLADDPLDLSNHYKIYRSIVHGGVSLLWDGPASGFGGTTKIMLEMKDYDEARSLHRPPMVASNGSLMRCSPVALRYYREPGFMAHISKLQSSVTHLNPIAGECCALYTSILAQVLEARLSRRESMEFAFRYCCGVHVFNEEVTSLSSAVFDEPQALRGKERFSAIYSLRVACHSFLNASSFEEGIERAILFGGDTDTNAAIAGGLLGAHFGFDGIPKRFIKGTLGIKQMVHLAKALHAAAVP